jgi:DNA methyltransferase 1-associated protein 1
VTDKIEAEIKVEQAKKAEREKLLAPKEPSKSPEPEGDSAAAAKEDVKGEEAPEATETAQGEAPDDVNATTEPTTATSAGDAAADTPAGQTNGEDAGRPGSSGAHKRSASELSTASDKSAKRQKK